MVDNIPCLLPNRLERKIWISCRQPGKKTVHSHLVKSAEGRWNGEDGEGFVLANLTSVCRSTVASWRGNGGVLPRLFETSHYTSSPKHVPSLAAAPLQINK